MYMEPPKPNKLSPIEKEVADQAEAILLNQWVNNAGKWVNRIKSEPDKVQRVFAEVANANKEQRIKTTPAQYAEYCWRQFK
jgi:hypothetical protein